MRRLLRYSEIIMIHADSKRVCAEFPKTNENPRTTVASGTKEARVFDRLKIRRHKKMIMTRATHSSTASSLATIEPTS
jgi:hypothetical protein